MKYIDFVTFDQIEPADFVQLLNGTRIRDHLIEHDLFDIDSAMQWMQSKQSVDSQTGCKVRAVLLDTKLAGWCGIQRESQNYEIAIVLDDQFWGIGRFVFTEILKWTRELGHKEIYIHLLHTRPPYKFLQRIAKQVVEQDINGNKFTSYLLSIQ